MAMNDHHTQCKMVRVEDGVSRVAWLPSKKARVGGVITIDGIPGNWRVVERWSTKPSEQVLADSQDYKHQREASDI
jgi:hypothetical protein